MKHHRIEVRPGVQLHAASTQGEGDAHGRPVVVFSHGFVTSGIESHGLFVRASREASTRGYSSVMFDYEGCGYSDGDYASFRVSTSARDLSAMVEWAVGETACNGQAIIFGQSLGSALAALSMTSGSTQAVALVLWNLSGRFGERYPAIFGLDPSAQTSQCVNGKGQYLGPGFFSDARPLDVLGALAECERPLFLLSCVGDDIGDPGIAAAAAATSVHPASQHIRIEASHTFMCQRDLEGAAIGRSFDWLDEKVKL
ncbi:MAG: hypothetical protein JWM89_1305 [Acidimicrobiales bacterium]|nr:hypothetical protein [Acidimicrobiales bacterium]